MRSIQARQLAASLASILAGLAIGWLAGASRGEGEGSDGGSNRVSAAAGKDRGHQVAGAEAGPRRDFAAYLKRVERQTTHPELEQAVARMSREELQTLLLETPEPDSRWRFDIARHLREKVSASAAAELLRRDGMAAMDWVEGIGRKAPWALMLQTLARVDPAALRERQERFMASPLKQLGLRLGDQALQGAATRSAKDVIECLKLGYDTPFEYVPEYAPGFDFAAVVAYLESLDQSSQGFGYSAKHLVGSWVATDPGAAAAAMIKAMQDPKRDWSETFAPALACRAAMIGEDAAAGWMAGILKQVPEERREGIVRSLIDHDLSTARAAGLIAHLEDRDRIALAVTGEDVYAWKYDHRPTVRLIQAMPTEELQMQALQAIARRMVRDRPAEARAGNLKQLESLMGKLPLSEAAMQKVFESAGGE